MGIDIEASRRFMQANYESGLTDEITAIIGAALDAAMTEEELDGEDVITRMESVSDDTLDRIDNFLGRSGPFFRLAGNVSICRIQAKALRIPFIRNRLIIAIKGLFAGLLEKDKSPKRSGIIRECIRAASSKIKNRLTS